MSIIKVENVHFGFDKPLWQGLNFTLEAGQRIGIRGPNGCGKSTLFNLLMGLNKLQCGRIWLNDVECLHETDFAGQRPSIGYLFQDPDDQLFCATVMEDVAFGPLNQGHSQDQAREISLTVLEHLGLSGYEKRITYHLSGGEKRLVSLASVWAMQPQAFLLDEPSAFLDQDAQQHLIHILLNSDKGWLMISHDMDFLQATCHEIWQVNDGSLYPCASL